MVSGGCAFPGDALLTLATLIASIYLVGWYVATVVIGRAVSAMPQPGQGGGGVQVLSWIHTSKHV